MSENPEPLKINGSGLIALPVEDTKECYLSGFWRWIELLARDDYERGVEALYWPKSVIFTPDALKKRVTTFWGGSAPWSVVVPNERLVRVVNDDAQCEPRGRHGRDGWFMAQIPVTTEPQRAKADDVILQGVAVSFFVREVGQRYLLELEIFHA